MALLGGTHLILAIISACSSLNISRHRSYTYDFLHQGNETIKYDSRITLGNNSVLYALCNGEKLPKEMNCDVIRETPTLLSSAGLKQMCKLTLIADANKRLVTEEPFMSLNSFGPNRVIIVWGQTDGKGRYGVQYIWYTILDMLTCVAVDLDFFFDSDRFFVMSNPIVYDNAFDVIITNKAICGSEQCRLSYDRRGKRIGQPAPFPSDYQFIETTPVMPFSNSKGFYQVGIDVERRRLGVAHLSPEGVRRDFVSSPINQFTSLLGSISSVHELMSVCWPEVRSVWPERLQIVCIQFDAEANVMIDAEFQVTESVKRTAVHNSADGGILLVAMECSELVCERFSIVDVRHDGYRREPFWMDLGIKLNDPNDANDVNIDVSESADEICFIFSRVRVESRQQADAKVSLQLYTICVAK
ncbi:hypothetical protein QAD02_014330 [Eretmocerus hayati]|uniref:Uncharacterized protein n=1 Tax=Eretmocerus hayati TaxID=131215 RepID=A0ACC2P620_9HYME|nr:hypothetical protein QAD02_014330 [Eretmocerus hayati]